jgi:nitrite reductase/ring-hydroxylating ferredoxin subunit
MLGRLIRSLVEAQRGWANPFGGWLQKLLRAILRPVRPIADFLHGRWLGHSLHAALTDVPVGASLGVIVLDWFAQRDAADALLALTVLGMLAAAIAGLADYSETDGKARDYGTVHATIMVVALVLFVGSLLLRRADPAAERGLPIWLVIAGFALLALGAHIGGDLVYLLGNMVDRHAWRGGGAKWTALEPQEFAEGQPLKARAGAQSLLVVRKGADVHVLHDTCAHAGCALSEGKLVDDTIECGCHGSRYRLADGRVVRGPATFDQPRFEVRRGADGKLEARRGESPG